LVREGKERKGKKQRSDKKSQYVKNEIRNSFLKILAILLSLSFPSQYSGAYIAFLISP